MVINIKINHYTTPDGADLQPIPGFSLAWITDPR